MTKDQPVRLTARGVFKVTGADARTLLQGLLTCDFADIAPGSPAHGALLTPQGKILFEAIVHQDEAGAYLFDCESAFMADFVTRLSFYRLRAKAEIASAPDMAVAACPGSAAGGLPADPRLAALGARAVLPMGEAQDMAAGDAAYHAHRIACSVAELGRDYMSGEVFPHEANHDQLGGVDFSKGCFVGQEVVSRMQHRGTARKRFVPVSIGGNAPAIGTEVTAGGRPVGTMGSSAGARGLALLRLDRLEEAVSQGNALFCGGTQLTAHKPAWARFAVPGEAAEAMP